MSVVMGEYWVRIPQLNFSRPAGLALIYIARAFGFVDTCPPAIRYSLFAIRHSPFAGSTGLELNYLDITSAYSTDN